PPTNNPSDRVITRPHSGRGICSFRFDAHCRFPLHLCGRHRVLHSSALTVGSCRSRAKNEAGSVPVSHAASIPLAAIGQHCVWHARGWHSKITSMYCPVCGAEYRPGFTECSDCQVALVAEPPHASSDERSAEYSSYVTVWSGDDPLKHAEILESLDEAGIPTRDLNREDRSFHLVTMPAFEVFVPDEFADSAQEVLKQIAAIENPDEPGSGIFEIPADEEEDLPPSDPRAGSTSSPRAGSTRPPRRGAGRSMSAYEQEEEAGTEVWSGQDAATANMIALSLRENEIPF